MSSPELKPLLLLAILAGLVLAVSACNNSGSPGPPLTADEFIIRGDEICASGVQERAREESEWFGDGHEASRAELRSFVAEVVGPNYRKQLEKLRELSPPPGDEERIDAILVGMEDLAREAERDPEDMLKATHKTRAARLAAGYGFAVCGA